MPKYTITEALAETKLLKTKIKTKKDFIGNNVGRMDVTPDPFEKEEGGSVGRIKREFQAIDDYRKRLIGIRTAIQNANSLTRLKIGEREMSITDWLNWKREVADEEVAFINQALSSVQQLKTQNERNPQVLKDKDTGAMQVLKPVFHLDQSWLQKQLEVNQEISGELDGKLSMLNATTFIEV